MIQNRLVLFQGILFLLVPNRTTCLFVFFVQSHSVIPPLVQSSCPLFLFFVYPKFPQARYLLQLLGIISKTPHPKLDWLFAGQKKNKNKELNEMLNNQLMKSRTLIDLDFPTSFPLKNNLQHGFPIDPDR